MITSIHLKHFKSHKNTNVELSNITLLCGENGSGKSSLIQNLLLLRQSFQKNRLEKVLSLNKPLCYIGEGKDALFSSAEKDDIIKIEFGYQKIIYQWMFDAGKGLNSDFIPYDESTTKIYSNNELSAIPIFNNSFQYISAGRLAVYESDDYAVEIEQQISLEEGKAELTAHFLDYHKAKNVIAGLLHPTAKDDSSLIAQTIAWEQEICKGVKVHPKKVGNSYEVRYSFPTELGGTEEYSTKNVGFGLSYALPVIVAILSAQPGTLLIIENPEAHLHPYGQAKIAELMSLAAQAGIQIIAETHSDHIINGVLVQNKKSVIDTENIKIWYFDREEEHNASKVTEVELMGKGRIKKAPAGFFDQIGKDLRILMSTNPS